MNKAAISLVTLLALVAFACGGGDDGDGDGNGSTTTETPTVGDAQVIQVIGTADFTLDPSAIELKIGQSYQFVFENQGNRGFRFRVPRWDIALFAPRDGVSEPSDVFVPEKAGTYDCFEEFFAARENMRCVLTVVE